MPATARASSSCGSPARPMRRSRGPAAASSSTVQATRAASEDDLVARALPRLDRLIAEGVTTVEIKSGYGLDLETELRMLARRARGSPRARQRHRRHELPRRARPAAGSEWRQGRYIDEVCDDDPGDRRATSSPTRSMRSARVSPSRPSRSTRVFAAAQAAGLPVKLHADQLSNLHGAKLAARPRRALGRSSRIYRRGRRRGDGARRHGRGAAAGAFYVLREKQVPPVEAFRRHGVPIAIATDSNPGTSPITSLLLDHEHGGDAVPAHGR